MGFIDTLKSFFAEPEKQPEAELSIPLAKAVLFLEAAAADEITDDSEKDMLRKLLEEDEAIDDDSIEGLIETAREHSKHHPDVFHYTRHMHENLSREERMELLVQVWMIVLADGVVSFAEDSFTRKLVNLLRLERPIWVVTRDEAKKRLNHKN